jgi:hypothetical protein
VTQPSCPPHPEFGAGVEAWRAWVDQAFPYRAKQFSGPFELRMLTTIPDRDIAALAAEQWFRRQAKEPNRRQQTVEPTQLGFDGETWGR